MIASCRKFNGLSDLSNWADDVEEVYRREWPRILNPKLYPEEKKALAALLTRALRDPISVYFREAVDPVALNIPSYFDVYVLYLFVASHILMI